MTGDVGTGSAADPPRRVRRWPRRAARAVLALLCLAVAGLGAWQSLVLRGQVPLAVKTAPFDESLFVRLGTSLAAGEWLGPYDEVTLMKGPAYPMLIGLTHRAGVPLKLAEHGTHLIAAALLALAVVVTTRRAVAATAVFLVVAFDPTLFAAVSAPVRREGWYAALSLLVLAAVFLAVRGAVGRGSLFPPGVAAALGGFTLAAFWLCREEGVWLVPALLLLLAGLPLVALWRGRGGTRPWVPFARVALVLLVLTATAVTPVLLTRAENDARYGAALTNDNSTGAFARAWADWGAVDAGPRRQFVSVSRAQREAVYAISPSARRLRPILEDPQNVWLARSRTTCRYDRVCDEYVAWVEAFAAREAAAQVGEYGSAAEADLFWSAVSADIRLACAQGRLRCSGGGGVVGQVLRGADPGAVWASTREGLVFTLDHPVFRTPVAPVAPPIPEQTRAEYASAVVGTPASLAAHERAHPAFHATAGARFARLADGYDRAFPWLLGLAVAGLLAAALAALVTRGRGPGRGLGWLVTALGLAALSRAGLLGVMDTTTLVGANVQPNYQQPTRALALGFAVTGTVLLAAVLVAGAASLLRRLRRT